MTIPPAFVQELLARVDVVEVVGRHVQLKKGGANFMGLCPFHAEKSPSFSVSPAKQFYHCFGCGKSGDAITFLVEHLGMNFRDAVQDLAQQHGLAIPQDDHNPAQQQRSQQVRQQQQSLVQILEKAAQDYQRQLKHAPNAVHYLKQRGLTGAVAKQFGLGYAPAGWHHLAGVFAAYDHPNLVESGLVIAGNEEGGQVEKRYDRFRDRIMFPIRNIKGECIGFGARVLGQEKPKYLNSPETPVFSKGRELYGLFEARHALRTAGYALVTEGYMDVVALAQLGFPNAVATLGTACTAEHVQKLFRLTETVVFSFDGDAAGRRAARKALLAALPHASDTRSIKFLFLPEEHDPDSFIRAHGQAAFAQQVDQAIPLSQYLVDCACEDCALDSAEGRAKAVATARPMYQALPEGALKLQILQGLSVKVRMEPQDIAHLWSTAAPGVATPTAARLPDSGTLSATRELVAPTRRRAPNSRADHALRILLQHSDLWQTLSNDDHALLCALPPPHGPLLLWLEAQLHEHGPMLWSALRLALVDQAGQQLAHKLMENADHVAIGLGAQADSAAELRDLLDRMLFDQLKLLEAQTIAAASTDPQALQRYQALRERRRSLIQRLENKA